MLKYKNWMKRASNIIVIVCICMIIGFIVFDFKQSEISVKEASESYHNYLISLEIEGLVIDRYVDTNNHSFKRLNILNNNDTLFLILGNDKGGLFYATFKGDSIIKEQDCDMVILKRPTQVIDTLFLTLL
jgi:hypothetical protein